MSEDQLKAFLDKVKGDASLQEKLKSAADAESVVVIAKEAGLSISVDDLNQSQPKNLSEQELEGVAGGKGNPACGSLWTDFFAGTGYCKAN